MKAYLKINETTVTIQCGYHKKLRDLFNSIEGKNYDNNEKTYSFPIEHKDSLIKELIDLNVSVEEVSEFASKKDTNVNLIAFYIENDNSFDISTEYSVSIRDLFREVQGKWNAKKAIWTVSKDKNILEKIKNLGYKVIMITDPLAQFPDNPLYQLNAWKSKKLIAYVREDNDNSLIELSVPYNEDLVNKIKTINGRKFDALSLLWSFPKSEFENLQKILADYCYKVNNVKEFPKIEKTAKFNPIILKK